MKRRRATQLTLRAGTAPRIDLSLAEDFDAPPILAGLGPFTQVTVMAIPEAAPNKEDGAPAEGNEVQPA